jgi:hypothetical protein
MTKVKDGHLGPLNEWTKEKFSRGMICVLIHCDLST